MPRHGLPPVAGTPPRRRIPDMPALSGGPSRDRLRLDQVSLLCVETRRPQLALYAMERCLRQIDFGECLLLSPTALPEHPVIRHVAIPDIASTEQYSEFMLHRLGDHFSKGHVL